MQVVFADNDISKNRFGEDDDVLISEPIERDKYSMRNAKSGAK